MRKRIIIFGATGSIGTQTLEIIDKNKDKFELIGVASKGNVDKLKAIAEKFKVPYVALFDNKPFSLSYNAKTFYGKEGLEQLANLDSDLVIMSISGIEAVYPLKISIERGANIAIATKEIVVACGDLIKKWLKKSKSKLIPIDSEHSALFQLINSFRKKNIEKIILTASGGPFWNKSREEMEKTKLEEVLKHPTWKMGYKTTIDSANLVNKGLEVIEAHFFFNFDYNSIKVMIHPQSIVHGMIELVDGSIIAQMAYPDMRIPIQYALFYPQRPKIKWSPFDLKNQKLEFYDVDYDKFPALQLAYEVGKKGGVYPAIFAISDEVLVELFIKGIINFKDIVSFIKYALESWKEFKEIENLEQIEYIKNWIKNLIKQKVGYNL
ncbi:MULTISPECIES: 1-deoxy-D-xylulose-5-phosphate reductoisomerase [Dictyoglomus]|jgi:1-deoxy-D-xylulose-5-phosphate reductoisomerase|uniref:1-deoxy-D-xylulose 5-phosphate reductoisomerase n=1 Tax=Dictyoglomus turgidum (strain DSM 6724 / Z-1310) TaxID=515635 RepID=B8E2X6_DICTD|nr:MULTISPECIES: 1-deoxy-D-xylulose-5-phosphate reductoisomerase [Dictyoglomus]ACK42476.1 1-deoxy-D-xylulose 5-phosphate reductoisomerase [Dictyoglomus turgidum DSM 6724]PNV79208.1 MAG: 1-deoxy-D-xylulose-5-phosphate reductoisomerase [Dictyoglomus turgidum]HBU32068.1 1-deoxy-D-xylulose-5-phosphate reductoisomerase [Dictyoglomus sp.]